MFTVMIQLGSILAVMWLYRAKILGVVARPAVAARGAAFRADDRRGVRSGAAGRRAAADYVKTRAVSAASPSSRWRSSSAASSCCWSSVPAAADGARAWTDVPAAQALGDRRLPGAGADSRRLAVGRDDRRRHGRWASIGRPRRSSRSFWRCRRWPRRSRTICSRCRHHLAPERALEIAVGFVMAFIASLLVVKPFLNIVRRSGFAPFAWYRIVARAWSCSRRLRPAGCRLTHALAAPQLHRRVLRHRAAVHQRGGVHLDLRRRRRAHDAALRPVARPAHSRAGDR